MVPESLLDEVARRFSLLGDPTRLRILSTLHTEGELSVGELARRAGVARDNASQHLRRLTEAGLLSRRHDGPNVYYAIVDQSLEQMCDLVCTSLRQRARALASM